MLKFEDSTRAQNDSGDNKATNSPRNSDLDYVSLMRADSASSQATNRSEAGTGPTKHLDFSQHDPYGGEYDGSFRHGHGERHEPRFHHDWPGNNAAPEEASGAGTPANTGTEAAENPVTTAATGAAQLSDNAVTTPGAGSGEVNQVTGAASGAAQVSDSAVTTTATAGAGVVQENPVTATAGAPGAASDSAVTATAGGPGAASDSAVAANNTGTAAPGSDGSTTVNLGNTSTSGISWGVWGKPTVGAADSQTYADTPVSQQIADVKSLGVSTYVTPAPFDLTNTQSVQEMQNVISTAAAQGIQVEPTINVPQGSTQDPTSALAQGLQVGQTFAQDFGSEVNIAQIGNEMDLYTNNGGNRMDASSYNTPQFQAAAAYTEGVIQGIKQVDPSMTTVVNIATGGDGYLQALQSYEQANNLPSWDETGLHLYVADNPTSIAQDLTAPLQAAQQFGKPIDVSELDAQDVNANLGPSGDPQTQASTLTTLIGTLDADASTYGIKQAAVYELYNEPDGSGDRANYGIMMPGSPTVASNAVAAAVAAG